MIVLLYNQDVSVADYACFLEMLGVTVKLLRVDSLLPWLRVTHKVGHDQPKPCWHLGQQVIDFGEVTSIYYAGSLYPGDGCEDFEAEDKKYAVQEWYAYLWYFLSRQPAVVNAPGYHQFAGHEYMYPSVFKAGEVVGFDVPAHIVTGCEKELQNFADSRDVIFTDSVYTNFDFRRGKKRTKLSIGAVEFVRGAPVRVYVCGQAQISFIRYREGMEVFELPESVMQSCYNLMSQYGLEVAELLLHRTTQDAYVLYRLSPTLNWLTLPKHYQYLVWRLLANFQLKGELKLDEKPYGMKATYIHKGLRPYYLGRQT